MEFGKELRVADYLKAYNTTGKPPLPCPTLPTDARERMKLGLPPLFKPHVELGPQAPSSSAISDPNVLGGTSGGGKARSIPDAGSLPAVQSFQPVSVWGPGSAAEVYQSIASQPEFLCFSHEVWSITILCPSCSFLFHGTKGTQICSTLTPTGTPL